MKLFRSRRDRVNWILDATTHAVLITTCISVGFKSEALGQFVRISSPTAMVQSANSYVVALPPVILYGLSRHPFRLLERFIVFVIT